MIFIIVDERVLPTADLACLSAVNVAIGIVCGEEVEAGKTGIRLFQVDVRDIFNCKRGIGHVKTAHDLIRILDDIVFLGVKAFRLTEEHTRVRRIFVCPILTQM